jgi:hypothetical protein
MNPIMTLDDLQSAVTDALSCFSFVFVIMMGNLSSAKDTSSGEQVAIKKVWDSYPGLVNELTWYLFTGVSYL